MAKVGIVQFVTGTVKAVSANGKERTLHAGDKVLPNDRIVTGDDGAIVISFNDGTTLDLGRDSQLSLTDDALVPENPAAKAQGQTAVNAQDEVEAIQKALADENFDPTKALKATAAGGDAGGGTAPGGNEGHTFVIVDYLNPETAPDSGFGTEGISVAFPPPEDVLILNPAQPVPEPVLPVVSVDVVVDVTPDPENPQDPIEITATTPGVLVDGVSIVEGTDAGTRIVNFIIQLDKVFDKDVTVTYEIKGMPGSNGATAGSDFVGVLTGTVTIPAGETSFIVPVEIVQDSVIEPNETFQIMLTSAINATISPSGSSAVVTIIDDDVNADDDFDSTTEGFLQDNSYTFDGNVNVLTNDDLSNAVDNQGSDLFGPLIVTTLGPVPAFAGAVEVGTVTFTSTGEYTLVLNDAGQALVDELGTSDDSFEVTADYSIINQLDSTDTATLHITINGTNDVPLIIVDPDPNDDPTVVSPDDQVYESDLAVIGSTPDGNKEFAAGIFTLSDPDGLDDIESVTISINGNPTVIAIADLGNNNQIVGNFGTLTITSYDSNTGIAEYTYELTQPYDTDPSADNGNNVEDNRDVFTLTTFDGEATSAEAFINIDIVDDVPTANDDGVINIAEDTPKTFDVFGNDIFGADGVDTDNNPDVAVTFTQAANGTVAYDPVTAQFTYTPNTGFAGADSFTYTITDGDGDTSTATVSLLVAEDSTPQIGETENLTVDEDGFVGDPQTPANVDDSRPGEVDSTESLTDSGTVAVDFGNDLPADLLAAFALLDTPALDGQLTSNGQPVTFALDGSGDLVGSIDGGATEVIRIEITGAVDNGGGNVTYTYSATLSEPVEQPAGGGENSITLSGISFEVTDSDGSTAQSSFSATIYDDIPVNNDATLPAYAVHEDALVPDGNNEGGKTTTATILAADIATLVDAGADTPVTISLNLALAGADSLEGDDTGLTQDGVAILWHVNGDHLEGVVGGSVVFTLSPNGDDFDFVLLENIDHDSDGNLLTGEGDSFTESLSLAGVFVGTDTDGDSVVINAGANVTIENDVPINNDATLPDYAVHEDALVPDGNNEGGKTTTATILAADIATLVDEGADKPVTISLNLALAGADSLEGDDTGLTQDGVAILWHVNGDHLEGVVGGNVVFTLSPNGDDFDFVLLENIDHDSDGNLLTGEGDSFTESLSLAGVFVGTDTDGDSVVINAGASVTIENDVPINNDATLPDYAVHEDALPDGNSAGEGVKTTTATILAADIATLVDAGADTPVTISLNLALVGADSLEGDDTGLTQDGVAILWHVNGDHLEGVVGGNVVFTLSPNGDDFDFVLLENIDHDDDGNLLTGEGDSFTESLSLAGVFVGTDTDGDTVVINAGASVTIENDVPIDYDPTDGLLKNSAGETITESLNSLNAIGADDYTSGDTNVTFNQAQDGTDSGFTSGSATIFLYVSDDGKTLTGSTSATEGGVDGSNTVYTVTIDDTTDQYTLNMIGTIDNGAGVSFADLSGTGEAGNPGFKIVESSDPASDLEILFTPLGSATSVNSDSDDVAVGSQFIVDGDGLRVDFGKFSNDDKGTGTGQDDTYVVDEKENINGFRFSINQISNGTTVTLVLAAYDDFDLIPDNNVQNDTQDSISRVEVYNNLGVLVDSWDTGDANGSFFTDNGDGTVTVSGIGALWSVVTYTADGYDGIEILNDATLVTDGKFSLSNLEVVAIDSGDPIQLNFDTVLTDSDGDASSGSIDVTLAPEAATVLGTSGDDVSLTGTGVDDMIYGGDGNDTMNGAGGNDILVGGAGDDTMTGGTGSDMFVWLAGDSGTDTITSGDFTPGAGGDTLNLADLLQGETSTAVSLDNYLNFSYDNGTNTTTITVDIDGAAGGFTTTQTIVLEGVDLTAGGTLTDAQIINNLLGTDNLQTDV